MRIGLVGAGRIGSCHARTLAAHPEVSELLVADVVPERAAELAGLVGGGHAATPAEVLARKPAALVVAAATEAHAELVTAAAARGLPVFCEKPLAPDPAGTRAVLDAVAAAGTLLQVGFMRRFDAGYRAAREAVAAGRLGRLHTVRTVTSDPAPPPAAFLPRSGGLFRDCVVHDIDAVRWVTGREVVSVQATGSDAGPPAFRAADDVDTGAALLTLDDGTLCTATATRLNGAGYDVRMELAGERAQFAVGLDARTPLTPLPLPQQETAPPATPWTGFLDRFAPAYRAELDAFLRAVRGAQPNPCPGTEALAAILVAEACETARREGCAVRL